MAPVKVKIKGHVQADVVQVMKTTKKKKLVSESRF